MFDFRLDACYYLLFVVSVDGDVRRLQSDSSERDETSIESDPRRSTDPASPLALVSMETPGPNTHICKHCSSAESVNRFREVSEYIVFGTLWN